MNALGDSDVGVPGIGGGDSQCRAHLGSLSGAKPGKGTGGPSHIDELRSVRGPAPARRPR
jgi:hypothetical protein